MSISYDFKEGQLVRLFHGIPEESWDIYALPDSVLREVLIWNDKDGDFEQCDKKTLLEIFLSDFIVSKA